MATPLKLNTGGPLTGNKPALRTAGAAAPRLRLKGANGQPIAPKTAAPAAPKTAAPAAPKTAAPAAQAEAAAAKAAEETAAAEAAALQAEQEAAAQAAAEAEAARLAQEEYDRQMEEYNRQMEEYNRQMAEFKAAEEAAAAAAAAEAEAAASAEAEAKAAAAQAEADAAAAAVAAQTLSGADTAAEAKAAQAKLRAAAKPAPKPGVAKSVPKPGVAKAAPKPGAALGAGALGKAGKPAAKKAPAAAPAAAPAEGAPAAEGQMSEEDMAARDAYLAALQATAEQRPIWKSPIFLAGVGVLVVLAGGCTYWVIQDNAKKERVQKHRDYIKKLLIRAQNINQKGVETMADARTKGVDVTCSVKDAKALLEVVVDPFVKGETGKPLYGNAPEGVAQNACLLIGLAAEADPDINKLVFETLGKKCDKIKPSLFHWQIQRLAITDSKGLNAKFRKLAEEVNAKPDWKKKNEVLSYIWEAMGLRVTEKDVPEILKLLKDEKTDPQLANNLSICLDNILQMMDDPAAKAEIGDKIFDGLSEKLRRTMAPTLAKACSAKALDFYKNELKDHGTWKRGAGLTFLGYWGNDEVLDYVLTLKEEAKGNEQETRQVNEVIGTIFRQNRDRSDAEAEKLLKLYFGDVFQDTGKLQDIINKTDPDSTLYVGDGSPELEKLKEERKSLESAQQEKKRLVKSLAVLNDYKWVTNLLERLSKDADDDIALDAKKAMEKVKENAVQAANAREQYKSREK